MSPAVLQVAPHRYAAARPGGAMFVLSLVYLMLTIIRPQDYMPALTGIPLLPVVLLLAFLLWLGSNTKVFAGPQFLLLLLFLLALMVSDAANGWVGGALVQLKTFGPIVIAFFVLASAIAASPRRVVVAFFVFVLCSIVLALHGWNQTRVGVGWTGTPLSLDGRIQYVGIFNDPNDLGLLFATAFPMAVYLSGRGGFLRRVIWLAGAALLLYGIFLTNSRGAMLAVVAIGAVYLWRRRGLVTALVLSGVGLVGMMMMPSRLQQLDVSESSAFGRVDAWYEGLHMFLAKPLFGVGAGNFTDYNELTAHNSLILVLAETGFFGYIIWLAFVGYGFWMMLTILRQAPPPSDDAEQAKAWQVERGLAFTLLLSLTGLFTAAFFLSRSYTVLLYLVAALVVGEYAGARQRFPDLPHFRLADGWWRWLPIAMISIAALFVMVALLLHSA
ncbi:hypothetical protein GCM10007862_11690 [Dyella lipolytica]|nr:O-antigen ligase family protein [Dyella lipolytica]GLQ46118.1 hypothetical protein GCM10007862_11690 [Dyella lipolytica]